MKCFLDKRPECIPSTSVILDLINEILTSNFFMYGTDFFLQTSGVAMGSKMSPSFASLYVGYFEQNIIFNNQENPYLHHTEHWKRYLDDVFFIWTGPAPLLQEFRHFINSKNKHLHVTIQSDAKCMNFLDVMVIKERDGLKTNLYRKPTDRNSLLHGESFHPTHLKKNLPISQFNRIRRICSSDEDFYEQTVDLKNRFKQRGYKDTWINNAASRFSSVSQDDSLSTTRPKELEQRTVCAIQYSPVSKDIEKIINKNWHIIETDPALKNCFLKLPWVVFKRPHNLRNMLVRADLPLQSPSHFLSTIPSGNYPCGRCQQCNFTHKTNSLTIPTQGRSTTSKE